MINCVRAQFIILKRYGMFVCTNLIHRVLFFFCNRTFECSKVPSCAFKLLHTSYRHTFATNI